jgi:glycosyltransferase involved in cell wall biosynthesis
VTAMGGAEKRLVETLGFFRRKNNLKIAVLESAPSLLVRPEINCEIHLLSSGFHGKRWLSVYIEWIFWAIKASIKSLSLAPHVKPDAILVPNNTLPNLFPGYVAGLVLRLPLCIVVHHIDIPFCKAGESKGSSVYSCYRSIKYSKLVSLVKTLAFYTTLSLLKKANGIIAVSNFTAEAVKNRGVSSAKISVSGNAVNVKLINNVIPFTNEKTYDGVFVGRIAKEKGIFELLNVWKRVVKARENAKLLIVGSGLELSTIKGKIDASGLENKVFLKEHCSERELYSLLKSSKVFIFPSLFEGWGIAVAEALACGLPVVAYDIPALRENFGKCESVFLVHFKEVKTLASTVLKILNSNKDEMNRFSFCSKNFVMQFTWENVAKMDLEALMIIKK